MCGKLESLPPKTAVLLHASCAQPDGVRSEWGWEWERISGGDEGARGGLLPFFDCAYQGLGEGLEGDAGAVRLFLGAEGTR